MIHSIEFIEDWRCFKIGERFEFRPGVNLLVGDQGCGKSSLLQAIQAAGSKEDVCNRALKKKIKVSCEVCRCYMFDFEEDNPRTKSYFGDNIHFQVASKFSSHGECNLAMLHALEEAADCLVMMDEPDAALSIRSCGVLTRQFRGVASRNSQVIAAVHNPAVIQQFEEVFSIEHRKWMTSAEFVAAHLACDYCGHYPCGCGG